MNNKDQSFTDQLISLFKSEQDRSKKEKSKEELIKSASKYLVDKIDDEKLIKFFEDSGISREELKQEFDERIKNTDMLLHKGVEGFGKIFNECQKVIFGIDDKEIKNKDEIQKIEKEFEGGDNYSGLLIDFAGKLSSKSSFLDSDYYYIRSVEPCKQQDCSKREQCNLRFLVHEESYMEEIRNVEGGDIEHKCVWICLHRKLHDLNFIRDIIKEIAAYMKDSETDMENKFTF